MRSKWFRENFYAIIVILNRSFVQQERTQFRIISFDFFVFAFFNVVFRFIVFTGIAFPKFAIMWFLFIDYWLELVNANCPWIKMLKKCENKIENKMKTKQTKLQKHKIKCHSLIDIDENFLSSYLKVIN